VGLALLLTFSRGALFLGLPAALLVVVILWRYSVRGRLWPWFVGLFALGAGLIAVVTAVPGVAGRLSLQGVSSFVRIDLWRSSLSMFLDHPLFGVGLDNFLYAYRERYILDTAWEEPSLSHPHNLILDFATRLGLAGLLVGLWLFGAWALNLYVLARDRLRDPAWTEWRPLLVALVAALAQTVAHGMVDQSFFLVDLAFAFFLMLGLTLWLVESAPLAGERHET
jgi:O-antigen ligase